MKKTKHTCPRFARLTWFGVVDSRFQSGKKYPVTLRNVGGFKPPNHPFKPQIEGYLIQGSAKVKDDDTTHTHKKSTCLGTGHVTVILGDPLVELFLSLECAAIPWESPEDYQLVEHEPPEHLVNFKPTKSTYLGETGHCFPGSCPFVDGVCCRVHCCQGVVWALGLAQSSFQSQPWRVDNGWGESGESLQRIRDVRSGQIPQLQPVKPAGG